MGLTVNVVRGHRTGKYFEFPDRHEITIGRPADDGTSPDVALHRDDVMVGRGVHARLERTQEGWRVHCLHPNGVVVQKGSERTKLGEGESHPVEGHVELTLGENGPVLQVALEKVEEGAPETYRPGQKGKKAPVGGPMNLPQEWGGAVERMKKAVPLLALLFVAGLGAGWWFVSQARTDLAAVIDDVQAAQEWVAELDAEVREGLTARMGEHERSVVIMGILTPEGDFSMVGTGWVAADGRLATNAHVAGPILQQMAQPGWAGAARRVVDDEVVEVPIRADQIRIHPGWDLWQGRAPHLLAYDVAVVDVRDSDEAMAALERLGPPFSLASEEELLALQTGDEVGYLGYPVAWADAQARQMPPLQGTGRITRITDYFYNADPGDVALQIHHSAISEGGSSGSPVVNRHGTVVGVHNAGAGRGFGFAQSVQFVKELLDGTAEAALVERESAWQAGYERYSADIAERLRADLSGLAFATVEGSDYRVDRSVFDAAERIPSGATHQWRVQPDEEGIYLVMGLVETGRSLTMSVAGEGVRTGRYPMISVFGTGEPFEVQVSQDSDPPLDLLAVVRVYRLLER